MKRTLAFLALAAVAARAEDVYQQVYNVGSLTVRVSDFKAPHLGFEGLYEDGPIGIGTSGGEEEGTAIPGEDLKLLISQWIAPGTWDTPPNSIEYHDGRLMVVHTKTVHDKIKPFLNYFRAVQLRTVVVEAEVVAVAPGVLDLKEGAILSDAQVQAIDAALGDASKGRLLATMRAEGMNGQRVHSVALDGRTLLRDWDIEIAQNQTIGDPIIGESLTGYALDVRSTLAMDGVSVHVVCRFTSSELAEVTSFAPGEPAIGPIEQPRTVRMQAKTTAMLPLNRTVLLASTAWSSGADPGWRSAVLLRASVRAETAPAEPPQEGKSAIRIFDTRTITASPTSFPGPRLGLPGVRAPEAPSTTFVPPEEEDDSLRVTADQLETLVKSNIDPDCWRDEGNNAIATMGDGRLIVISSPGNLQAIEAFLLELNRTRVRAITLDSWVIGLSEDAWRSRREQLTGIEVPEDAWNSILDAATRGNGSRIVGAVSATGEHGVRFHATRGVGRAMVLDYDVEIAQGASALDPVVDEVTEGVSLDARALVVGDGKRLRLELRPIVALATYGEAFELRAGGAKVQTVSMTDFGLETQILVNEGQVTLAGLSRREEGGKVEVLLLFVRAKSTTWK